MQDYVVLVNNNNKPLGIMDKLTAHSENTPLHRAFSLFLFNSKKELLIQQRSHKKKNLAPCLDQFRLWTSKTL